MTRVLLPVAVLIVTTVLCVTVLLPMALASLRVTLPALAAILQ